MSRIPILSKAAPAPSPHLSQAIICNGMVYCSGALGIHPQTRKLAGGAYEQTVCHAITFGHRSSMTSLTREQKQALANLDAILQEAGTESVNTVKATIFLSSMDHYAEVNRAYLEFFSADPKPVSRKPTSQFNRVLIKIPESDMCRCCTTPISRSRCRN